MKDPMTQEVIEQCLAASVSLSKPVRRLCESVIVRDSVVDYRNEIIGMALMQITLEHLGYDGTKMIFDLAPDHMKTK